MLVRRYPGKCGSIRAGAEEAAQATDQELLLPAISVERHAHVPRGGRVRADAGRHNNPYNQDNETGWIDWGRLLANADIFRFFKLMIAFRKSHPSLARSRFWREDVRWYGVGRDPDLGYDSRSLAFALHGGSQQDLDIYVMINASEGELTFQIQEGTTSGWRRVVDTSLQSPAEILEDGNESPVPSLRYRVLGRSVVVLVRNEDGA